MINHRVNTNTYEPQVCVLFSVLERVGRQTDAQAKSSAVAWNRGTV